MQRNGAIDVDVNELLWKVGWNWVAVLIGTPILGTIIILGVGGGLGSVVGGLTFFGGQVLAAAGLGYVRSNVGSVVHQGVGTVEEQARDVARIDDTYETFSFVTRSGESGFALPKPTRKVVTLAVSDSYLVVHDSALVQLASLS